MFNHLHHLLGVVKPQGIMMIEYVMVMEVGGVKVKEIVTIGARQDTPVTKVV